MGVAALAKKVVFSLTEKQKEARELVIGAAKYILLFGGSRSAKTFFIVWAIVTRALLAPGSRHLIVRYRFNHIKQSVINDTFPKVMKLAYPGVNYKLDKQDWFVKIYVGDQGEWSEIWFGGLDDKERTEKILGNEYATIFINEASQISYDSYGILITRLAQKVDCVIGDTVKQLRLKFFVDENPPSKGHWTFKLFIQKLNPLNKTPLDRPENYVSLLMNPSDNEENLADGYLETLDDLPERKRKRFKFGQFAEENENALWTESIIDENRVKEVPDLVRIVVGVDPSGASEDENENNDDIGIVVGGIGIDGNGYLLEDCTVSAGPSKWGKVVASTYERHKADRVVGETNFGGGMVEFVVRTANPNISYKEVRASRGKAVRAEPISALHETGKIKFAGNFNDLEDELCQFSTAGYTGMKSPNRADAFVWVFTELFPGITKDKQKTEEKITIPNMVRL